VGERTWLIAEAYREDDGRPFYQAGFRHWVLTDRLQIDATYGNRFGQGRDERWYSVGIVLLFLDVLP
jgi:hypothetical protein